MSSVEISLRAFLPPTVSNNFHDSVAPELLQHIIEYAASSTSRAWWQSRSRTLASLCLVSRRFRSIAQPLLYKKISLDTRSRFAKLLRSTPLETLGAVRLLYSGIKWYDELDLENLYTLAKFAPRIQSLTVNKSSWSLGPFAGSNSEPFSRYAFITVIDKLLLKTSLPSLSAKSVSRSHRPTRSLPSSTSVFPHATLKGAVVEEGKEFVSIHPLSDTSLSILSNLRTTTRRTSWSRSPLRYSLQ